MNSIKVSPLISDLRSLRAMMNVALSEFIASKDFISELNKETNGNKFAKEFRRKDYSEGFSRMNKTRYRLQNAVIDVVGKLDQLKQERLNERSTGNS